MGRNFFRGRTLGSKHAAAHGKTHAGAAPFRGARPEPVARLQRARPRESAPAYSWQTGRARAPRGASDGGDPQRARPASGAPMCRGTARGSGRAAARGPVFRKSRRPRAPRFQLKLFNWSGARACQGISWNCVNGFATVRKRLVQANACSGRPRRDPHPSGLRCGWPCTAWPTARPQPGSCSAEFDRCAPALLLGFTPLPVRCASVRRRHESQCAARRAWPAGALRDGVDSLCADRRRCAPWERGVSGSGGARACSRERAGARATPTH